MSNAEIIQGPSEQDITARRAISPEIVDDAVQIVVGACNGLVEEYRRGESTKANVVRRITGLLEQSTHANDAAVDTALASFVAALDSHDAITIAAHAKGKEKEPTREDGGYQENPVGSDEDAPPLKRVRVDDNVSAVDFPWSISESFTQKSLSPSLRQTIDLLTRFSVDVKKTKRSLLLSQSAPEFPESEWANIIAGRAINLDVVHGGYYTTSNGDRRTESIADGVEISFGTEIPSKTITTGGEWNIAWHSAARATAYAFPHRHLELSAWGDHINNLLSAIHPVFHSRVLNYDKNCRKRVGSRRDLELTSLHEFSDLKIAYLDNIGIEVPRSTTKPDSPAPRASSSGNKRIQEPCNRWNLGLCTVSASSCRRLHVCSKCKKPGHKAPTCRTE